MIPSTAQRVPENTATHVNDAIRRQTEENVARTIASGPEAISHRLSELDREWDTERTLEMNASLLAFTGVILGAFVNQWFLILPAVVTAFLFQHAVQGWCPPLPLFRRAGFRTQSEIDYERYALKALRGDFRHLQDPGSTTPADAEQALSAVMN